ncbi:MAG: hypothetical protein DMF83_00590 [Acidobacteria bacterium]|nr:MAG: hypothetical protein DMF83_00590 [Acidobacteriota bacterium]
MNEEAADHGRWRHAPTTAVCCLTVVFFAPLLAGRTFSMVGPHMYAQYPWIAMVAPDDRVRGLGYPQTDHAETMYPLSVFATSAVRAGDLPLWLPFSFGGIPALELGASGLLYPPRLLAMLVLEPIRQHDLLLFVHLLAAGVGMALLLAEWGADGFGATVGGLTWELSGHNAFWLTLEHMAIAAAWLPLALLAATRAVRRQSLAWAAAAGAGIGMSLLGGNLHYVLLSILIVAGGGAWVAGRELIGRGGRTRPRRYLEIAAAALVVGSALGAACWLPLLPAVSDVNRRPASLDQQVADAVPWRVIVGGATALGTDPYPEGKLPDWSHLAYAGLPGLALAAVAAFSRNGPGVRIAQVSCGAGLAMALGWRPLLVVMRAIVPFFGTFHPHEGLYVYVFGVAALAGLGLTRARGWLADRPHGARWANSAASLLTVGQAGQLILFGWNINPQHPAEAAWLFPSTPLVEALQASIGDGRMLPVRWHLPGVWTPPVLAGKTPGAFGLRSGSGYESVIPRRTAMFWAAVEAGQVPPEAPAGGFKTDFWHDRLPFGLMEKASVKLLAVPPGIRPLDVSGADPGREGWLRPLYRGGDGWVYEDVRALPRALVVPAVRWMSDDAAVLRAMAGPDHDARAEVLVVGSGSPETGSVPASDAPTTSANIVHDRLSAVEVQTTGGPGILVLNDSWGPGWKAFVDGVEAPVLRVNYAFRGVRLRAGSHAVHFVYRPFWLLLGLAVSASTLTLLTVGLILRVRWGTGYRSR